MTWQLFRITGPFRGNFPREYTAIGFNLNSSPLGQNGHYFEDDIFKQILLNANGWILIGISLNFVPKDPIDNKQALSLDNGLAPNRRQAIIWANANPIIWCILAAIGGDESILFEMWQYIEWKYYIHLSRHVIKIHTCMSLSLSLSIYIYIYIYIYMCVCMCVCVRVCVYMYLCIYVYIFVCIFVCVN